MERFIIGIVGPKGSGKSEVAKLLVKDYDFERTRFAERLKLMLMVGFGLTREQVDGDLKEVPTDKLCGKTPRDVMKTGGTEWGREMIHDDIWTVAWKTNLPNVNRIVVDDMRFPNEHKLVKSMGGIIFRVERPGYEHDPCHESERHILEADYLIHNSGDSLKGLRANVSDLMREVLTSR